MDEQTQSYGSFGNVSPEGMQAIKEALNRRGMGDSTPALGQQSGASPTPSPLPAQPTPSGLGGSAPGEELGGTPMPTPAVGQNPEAKMIVGALRERLKALSQLEIGG